MLQMFSGCTNVWWACTIALLPIQVSREISKTEKLLFGFDLAPTLIPGWCWSKFLMQPVFLGGKGREKSQPRTVDGESSFEVGVVHIKKCLGWALIWNLNPSQNPTEATCKLQFRNLITLLLLICYICCKTDEVFCFAAHLSRTTDLPSFYPKRLDHRAHSALGYLEKYKSFTQQYSGLKNSKIERIIRPHDLWTFLKNHCMMCE